MRVKNFVRIGKHHLNNCEDSTGTYKVGDRRELIVVCDGCSMGNKSHYVSELIQKLIREISKEEDYREYGTGEKMELKELLKIISKNLFNRLQSIYQITGSHKYDYLSTVILAIVDELDLEYAYLVSGDGVISVDGDLTIFDQNNQPNYIGYHLDNGFVNWFENQVVLKNGRLNNSIAVSTDGILTFSSSEDKFVEDDILDKILKNLLSKSDLESEKELQNKMDDLFSNNQISTTDDIAICKLEIE